MIHETYETVLLNADGSAAVLEHGQTFRVTMTEVEVYEENGERLIRTLLYVVLK